MHEVLTNDHDVEVEALAHALAMPLVGQVGEADVARQLPPNDVPIVAHSWRSCSHRVRWSLARNLRSGRRRLDGGQRGGHGRGGDVGGNTV